MKIRFKVLSAILLITMLFTGCMGNSNENGDSAKGVKIARTGNSLFVMSASNSAGTEIVIDEAIDAANIKFENGNLGIVKTTKNKTIISVIKPNGEIEDNELMFSVYNTPEKLSIKADKVVSSKEADEAYEKEAKNIAKRAVGDVLVGDFNTDGIIDVADFKLFATGYAATYSISYDIAPAAKASSDSKWADIYSKSTADGNTDIFDFIIFGRNYGKTNPDVNVKSITLSGTTTVKEGKTTSLTATVTYSNGTTSTADVLTWTTSDATKATVANGTVTGVAAGTAVITAEKDGIKGTTTVTVEKVSTGLVMYLKKPSAWTGANAYVWTGTGTTAKTLSAAWPGTAMTAVSGRDGWYSITLEGATAPVSLVFNGNGTDAQKTTDLTCTTQEAWYDAAWVTNPWQPQGPTVTLAGAGTYVAGTYDVTVNVAGDNVTVIKYTKDGTDPKTNGTAIANGGKVSVTLAKDATVTVKVYAENSVGGATGEAVLKYGEVVESKGTFSWDNALMYFVITDRFNNGDTTNDHSYGRRNDYGGDKDKIATFHGGDIKGLTAKLDYIESLGVNSIWITAPYEQIHGWAGGGDLNDFPHYSYHGYYPLDFTGMDKNMGTVEEFRTFVKTAHGKGIRVVMDIVMNHVGYNTLLDCVQYNFGGVTLTEAEATNHYDGWAYHDKYFKYSDASAWTNWWGSGWIRAGVTNIYKNGDGTTDGLTGNVGNLPDVKTEVSTSQGLPMILKNKWAKEASGFDNWIVPAAKELRKDIGVSPVEYEIKWLAAWVTEFGIDGFRVDTAKHVEQYRWKQLKEAGSAALKAWRAANPTDPASKWTDDFWMTGEHWNFTFGNDFGYYSNGFNSMINFGFPKSGDLNSIGGTWKSYADAINNGSGKNVLNYISSHDAGLSRGNMINLGTTLILTPGGAQIFYGDETARPVGPYGSDKDKEKGQGTRADMNWGANPDTLAHWQKVGKFRKNHVSVGAGTQTDLGSNTYGRTYNKNGVQDSVVINVGGSGSVAVSVSGIFADGTAVRNAYDGATGTVAGGKVTFTASNGVILIEKQ